MSASVPGFRASERGFRFTNSFPAEPDVVIDLGPFGKVGLGDASQGVCGGMVFAVRDYFEAGAPVPSMTDQPAKGSPLFEFIVRRLIDSFNVPTGIAEYAAWLPMRSTSIDFLFIHMHGTGYRTVHDTWPAVKADIDKGRPSPLGVVPLQTSELSKIGKCHQVLAYGYVDEATSVTLNVYDPNTPNAAADDVWIRFPLDHPERGIRIDHNVNIAEPTLHGFFRSSYAPVAPPTAV